MLGRINSFFAGVVTGALLLAGASHYHVVRGKEGVFLVRKVQNNLSDVYVDTTKFTLDDWRQHKMLAVAMMKSEKVEVLPDESINDLRQGVEGAVDGWLKDATAIATDRP